jgi:hypothetical protein
MAGAIYKCLRLGGLIHQPVYGRVLHSINQLRSEGAEPESSDAPHGGAMLDG